MNQLKHKYLQSVKDALDEYFEQKSEHTQLNLSHQSSVSEVHHYHHGHSYSSPIFPILAMPPQPPQVIVVNNPSQSQSGSSESKEKKKEEKDDDNTTLKVVAVIAGVATSAIGTYVIAKDEYVNYWLSDIDEKIARLRELKDPELAEFLLAYDEWKSLFEKRTKSKTYAKATTIGSVLGGLGGAYLASTAIVLTGVVGATAGGCYLLWKHMTTRTRTEDQAFSNFKSKLLSLLDRTRGGDLPAPGGQVPLSQMRDGFRLGEGVSQQHMEHITPIVPPAQLQVAQPQVVSSTVSSNEGQSEPDSDEGQPGQSTERPEPSAPPA